MGKFRFLLGAAALCALSTPAFAILQIAIDVDGRIFISDTDFAPLATHIDWTGSGSWDKNSQSSTYSFHDYADAANTQGADPGLVTPGILIGTFSGSVGTARSTSFKDSGAGAFFATPPYSLTLEGNTTLSSDAELVGRAHEENGLAPEPSTWALMAASFVLLAGVGIGWKRRRPPPAFE
jgi:hypothetical protein